MAPILAQTVWDWLTFDHLVIGGGILLALVSIVTGTLRKMSRERHREDSRREIAAYVAEGSMTADDAAKILAAGKGWESCLKK